MGSRGPAPQTAEQLARQGSKRAKSRAKTEAAGVKTTGGPVRPSFCPAPLHKLFDELVATLPGLTAGDGPLLVALASAYDDLGKADAAVRKKGLSYSNSRGDQSKRPEAQIRVEARALVVEILKQLDRRGPTPTSAGDEDDSDPDFDK